MAKDSYPVVDLFAGPGGLGEGFSALLTKRKPVFETLVSIERDVFAHQTLLLRHFFRGFDSKNPPSEYYNYLGSGLIN